MPYHAYPRLIHSYPTRRSSDLAAPTTPSPAADSRTSTAHRSRRTRRASSTRAPRASTSPAWPAAPAAVLRSEEHTSELQSQFHLVCRLLLEKKNTKTSPVDQPQ